MARFTSSVERTFVTCSAPNITGGKIHRWRHCLHWRPKRLHYRSLSKESKNNIIFSGFCSTNVYYWSTQSKQCNYNFVKYKNHVKIHKQTLHWVYSTGCRNKLSYTVTEDASDYSKISSAVSGLIALSSAEAYMKFLVRERERTRSDGKS
jgi:hypothetical protein